jgi:hypothetical protein
MRFEATDPESRDAYRAEVEGWLERQKKANEAEKSVSGTR